MKMETITEADLIKIHPESLKELGSFEVALTMLQVGRDLRSGVIPRDNFNMRLYHSVDDCSSSRQCGTSHCIAGWMAFRLNKDVEEIFGTNKVLFMPRGLKNLFSGLHESEPNLAANAIEEYLFNHAERPWD